LAFSIVGYWLFDPANFSIIFDTKLSYLTKTWDSTQPYQRWTL